MPVDPTDVLFVSKPLCPPWDDSGKLLPYLLAKYMEGVNLAAMTPRGRPLDLPGVHSEEIYRTSSSFTVPMSEKIKLMIRLLGRSTPPLVHFFFSPNRPTTRAARLFRRLNPGVKVVQTVMSLPAQVEALRAEVFADVVVTWSRMAAGIAAQAVRSRGLPARVVHIPPGIEPLEPLDTDGRRQARQALGLPVDRPLVLYAGDLEFSSGAAVTAAAAAEVVDRVPALFLFACRRKTSASRAAERCLREDVAGLADRGHARILEEVPSFVDLLRCVDVQVLPSETTYAKTDIPLVLLEGLSAGIPAVVARRTPMDELEAEGAAVGVPPMEPEPLARTLVGMLEGKGRVKALGDAGRRYVLEHHTARSMARAHADLYNEVLRFG